MSNHSLLEELAARILDVEWDASDDEVQAAFRKRASNWHPDVSDEEDAQERFVAAQRAKEVLLGNVNFSDPDEIRTTRETLEELFTDEEVAEIQEEVKKEVTYRSSTQRRQHPGSYRGADFGGMSGAERSAKLDEIALGLETMLIYNAVSNLFEQGYRQEDFFNDVNDHIDSMAEDEMEYEDYWDAVHEHVRENLTKEAFLQSMNRAEEGYEQEFGDGTTIREVARTLSYLVAQGSINIGNIGRFVGGGVYGGDDRFSRHGSRDSRFGRDNRFS